MYEGKAFWAGVGGALMITLVAGFARDLGFSLDLELMLGSVVVDHGGLSAWMTGFVFHLLMGGLFGLAYGAMFERVFERAGIGLGVMLGAAHAVVAGVLLAVVPLLVDIPAAMAMPGPFAIAYGPAGVALLVAVHLGYGAIVGHFYAPARAREHAMAGS